MDPSDVVKELKKRYESGERNFQKLELRRANLRGLDLSNANLQGADLSYANLREVNLNGADLSSAYLNEADLTGANLQGAILRETYLIKTYLIRANLENANLHKAYLTGAYLTKANLSNARLTEAYLTGANLSGANFTGAYYDKKTRFDASFSPEKAGMQNDLSRATSVIGLKVTMEQLLETFNHLSQLSSRYLGNIMTSRYWESARPGVDWLNQFAVTKKAEIQFTGAHPQGEYLNLAQLRWAQSWIKAFVNSCSQIIPDYPKLVNEEKLVFAIMNIEELEEDAQENKASTSSSSLKQKSSNQLTAEDLVNLF